MSRTTITIAEAEALLRKKPQNLRKEVRQGNVPGGFTIGKHCYINWLSFSQVTGFTEDQIEEVKK